MRLTGCVLAVVAVARATSDLQRLGDGDLVATLSKICNFRGVQDGWRVFEFGQGAQTALCQYILALSAPSSVEWALRLVSHVMIDSVVVGDATATKLAIILRLVKQGIQLLFDIHKAPIEHLLLRPAAIYQIIAIFIGIWAH